MMKNKSYSSKTPKAKVVLPQPPLGADQASDLDVYSRFMRHLRLVPVSRMDIKILSSIQFTADVLGYSDAHVSKILIDHGLRASKTAFPADFLAFAERCLRRDGRAIGGPNDALRELASFWKAHSPTQIFALTSALKTVDQRTLVEV